MRNYVQILALFGVAWIPGQINAQDIRSTALDMSRMSPVTPSQFDAKAMIDKADKTIKAMVEPCDPRPKQMIDKAGQTINDILEASQP